MRFVLWLLAVVVIFLFVQKGHRISQSGEPVAFLPGGSTQAGAVTIRIEGDLVKPGVYQFVYNEQAGTVINMTVPFLSDYSCLKGVPLNNVYSGDVLRLKLHNSKGPEITRLSMSVAEKMLLGISLDPNKITAEEWQQLPGIGPSLARRIVVDRQINGEFATIEDLERVPGIGAAKVKKLERFFKCS